MEDLRYCTTNDYTVEASEKNLKQLAFDNQESVLFFDWYGNEMYYNETSCYLLNETNEVITIRERIINV